MSRFVVLLRGVNVGKGNKVPMADFRTALKGLGHGSVHTILNSGNAVFTSSRRSSSSLAEGIATVVQDHFGVVTTVIVKSAAEFEAIVKNNPFPPPEPEHSRFLVVFTSNASKLRELNSLSSLLLPGERFTVTEHAAYLHCAGGLLASKIGDEILSRTGRSATTRNWATVLKLSTLLAESAA
ncbi:MAG: hypothetical protein CFE41_16545 [Burkholderiales bacterium PBB2]|nr:MAG: hypothetical protein CFE41_16545 [Burkholderiales bacterium PBB2]